MTDLKTHQRLSKDPLAHLIANTLAEVLFATVMPHRGQAEQDLIARTSLLLADRVRFATGLPKMDDPVDPPSYAADGLTEEGEGKDTRDTNSERITLDWTTSDPGNDPELAALQHALRQALTNPEHTWLKDTP